MDIIKTQSPLTLGEKGVYPLTTADQIILSDGTRLEKNGKIDANTLNGIEVSDFVTKDQVKVYTAGHGISVSDDGVISLALENGDEVSY